MRTYARRLRHSRWQSGEVTGTRRSEPIEHVITRTCPQILQGRCLAGRWIEVEPRRGRDGLVRKKGETDDGNTIRLCHLHSHDPGKALAGSVMDPEFTRRVLVRKLSRIGMEPGASWRLMIPDGRVGYSGKVLEIEPERRLVLSWRANSIRNSVPRSDSRVTFELEPKGESVKLTVHHEIDRPDSKLVTTLSHGWPLLLASLKSLLETGESLVETPLAQRALMLSLAIT